MSEQILLVEDDSELGSQIVDQLTKYGYQVSWKTAGTYPIPSELQDISLVILDLMLPGVWGLDILKHLRTFSEIPVLVLSARNNTSDKVRALKLGADDYMTKPFWPEELTERVKARLRRPVMQKEGAISLHGVQIDVAKRKVSAGGNPVDLTKIEFDILAALMKRPGDAVTRQWLASRVLDPEKDGSERTLDVHVSHLRKKLGASNIIDTVWGIGYRAREESHK